VLRAQALVKVAEETVAARQLLVDQVTALFQNKLRSELDVSFVNVNLSQAQLLLLQTQDQVQGAFAELTRALGFEQAATYGLIEERSSAIRTAIFGFVPPTGFHFNA
jgi:outer membrane protein